ncbi:TetR/AcrR family transcriptional regulator [Paenibacillus sp. FSL H7-0350]|uniref:TetR/AcrR family transcriptional regulator n=1 Tax=Paenibacillus sp. FSL H7-0350 TaxID=2975345 RepID=UPI0031582F77
MNKQPQITEKTRQRFIEVFCELYSQKPIEKISVQEIANKSGYNRSTFYQYFTDIYELVDSVENDLLNEMKQELTNKELSVHTVQDTLSCLGKREHLQVLNALLGDYGSVRFLKRLKQEFILDQYLNIPQNHSLTPYFIEFYLTTTLSLFRLWLQRGKDIPPEEFIRLAENLYSRGITTYT